MRDDRGTTATERPRNRFGAGLILCGALAAIAAGAFSCATADDGSGIDTGEDPVCGDYGYGETTCEDIAANIMTCCDPGMTGACEENSYEASEQLLCVNHLSDVLDHCSCDDCAEHGDEACTEFVDCVSTCAGFYEWIVDGDR